LTLNKDIGKSFLHLIIAFTEASRGLMHFMLFEYSALATFQRLLDSILDSELEPYPQT